MDKEEEVAKITLIKDIKTTKVMKKIWEDLAREQLLEQMVMY